MNPHLKPPNPNSIAVAATHSKPPLGAAVVPLPPHTPARMVPGSTNGSRTVVALLATASFRLDTGSDSDAARRNDTVGWATPHHVLTL
jgi:hypothetical protein